MRRLNPPHDLFWVHLGAALTAILTVLDVHFTPVRIASGLIGALVLPGYALTAALFLPGRLDPAERIALTLGLSLVLAALGVLLFVVTDIHLTATAWAAIMYGETGAAVLLAAARTEPDCPHPVQLHIRVKRSTVVNGVSLGVAGIIAATSIAFAAVHAKSDHGPGFTELSLVPVNATAAVVTVTSHEDSATRFRLVFVPRAMGLTAMAIELSPNHSWRETLEVPEHRPESIEAILYRESDLRPYRRTFLAATESAGNAAGRSRGRHVIASVPGR